MEIDFPRAQQLQRLKTEQSKTKRQQHVNK